VAPIWDGPPECDPYLTLGGCDDNCEMSVPGVDDPEYTGLAGCNDTGTGPGTGDPFDPGGGGPPPPPADDPDSPCDPAIHPDCEKPLTAQDSTTINDVLANLLRPAAQFTDSIARAECAQMRSAFERAFAQGKVFRGAFDSDTTNDPYGSHWGMYSASGGIHFDPILLNGANGGDAEARRELAITALHEAAHWSGYRHPTAPTFDAQGRDYYTDPPFNRLNPGPNSCVAR
jgi:hypothetical protein